MGCKAKIKLIRSAVASGDQETCRQLVQALVGQGFKLRGRVVDRALRALPEREENVDPDAGNYARAVRIIREEQRKSDDAGTGRSTAVDREVSR